ncbi:MAG: hypothetical protein A3J63_02310 [Candidatus Moranbacteria bacterium RIFCSPHIGHO2_02_FULL_40_12b]|nr:MAG: hypothetical protein A3J63_02310 [Candidatus Moranbacteria bacterium RIFCSPHIGHO2_02_FULL_40_12b]OGI23057.1 MAG: hypothetical protein A3E91_02780 [Candidatus Moranbacteria bacterium RIFCSPHIGHO2_12_FULL_40_10]
MKLSGLIAQSKSTPAIITRIPIKTKTKYKSSFKRVAIAPVAKSAGKLATFVILSPIHVKKPASAFLGKEKKRKLKKIKNTSAKPSHLFRKILLLVFVFLFTLKSFKKF